MPSSLRCCACSRHLHAPRAAPTPSPARLAPSSPPRSSRSAVIAGRPPAPGRRAAAHPHHAPPHRPLSTCARPATLSPPRLGFPPPTSSTSSSSPLRPFSSTAAARAAVVDGNPFPFPRSKDASPFDIFHFRRDQALTAKEVKSRYLQLVKIYHPDRRAAAASSSSSSSKKGKHKAAPDADHEFKAIVAAYELLSSPSRRETYLRTGLGWGATASYRGGGGGGGFGGSSGRPSSPWSQSTAEYHFRRGRPMSHGRWAGQYDHWSWSQTWSDPHSPHFRPEDEAARRSGGMSSGDGGGATAPGWEGQGLFARNGVVFLVLAALTLTVTPLTAWSVVPSAPKGVDPFAPGSDGVRMSELAAQGALEGGSAWMPRVYDKRHQDAAANLQRARLEARERGHEKRDAIKRRVQELRRVQAFDRARDVQQVEQGKSGTGHLALPAPAPAAGTGATTGE